MVDLDIIGEKLKLACQMLARQQVTGKHYTWLLTEEMIRLLENEAEQFEHVPSVWIYFLVYKMMREENPTFYFELKKRLPKAVPFFNHQEGRDLYYHVLNYCIQRINFGEASFRKETFELYQQMLENGLLFVEEVLSQWDYTNIVSLGCQLKEFEWTQQFIFEQKSRLPKNEMENTFTYNLAAFYYNQNDFEKAISLLHQVEFSEVYYNLLTRLLRLKIYFDTNDWQALEYSLETFRIYLIRNRSITDQRRKSGLNLLRFTKKTMRLLEEKSTLNQKDFLQKIQNLQTQIERKDRVLNKAWLLSKIENVGSTVVR